MIKIINPGKPVEPVRFVCSACGCEYIADKNSYYNSEAMILRGEWIISIKCDCPNCGYENSANRNP